MARERPFGQGLAADERHPFGQRHRRVLSSRGEATSSSAVPKPCTGGAASIASSAAAQGWTLNARRRARSGRPGCGPSSCLDVGPGPVDADRVGRRAEGRVLHHAPQPGAAAAARTTRIARTRSISRSVKPRRAQSSGPRSKRRSSRLRRNVDCTLGTRASDRQQRRTETRPAAACSSRSDRCRLRSLAGRRVRSTRS